ncbi:MAG: SWIM zinc finger family protein [Victivallales bacterium]|nr:SWIM zinc finger family protein [Victivallales bacterium]
MSRWSRYSDYDYGYPEYVTAGQRKLQAQKKIKALSAKGEELSPVVIEGRKIAKTFWGKAWCDNIESYHDYENRLPRGRSYVRNGAVIDLKIAKGKITALVMGSELYEIDITIHELPPEKWEKIKRECAGKIASLIDLINGKLSPEIIELLCRKNDGMFPSPKEIKMNCNCPDWADLCKHLAAVLYGIGAKLDEKPELFFLLRGVDQNELFSADIADALVDSAAPAAIADDELNSIFGIELDSLDDDIAIPAVTEKRKPGRQKKAAGAKTPTKRKPGRPKKTEKAAVTATPEKRKPGRPKKVTAAKTPAKRKPGRPKKTEKVAVTATPEKRKPGRPKKSEAATPKKIASATGKKSTAKITKKISKKNTAGKKS